MTVADGHPHLKAQRTPSYPHTSWATDDGDAVFASLLVLASLLSVWGQAIGPEVISLIEKGRTYAATADGAYWFEALRGSTLVRCGWVAWSGTSLSTYLEANLPFGESPAVCLGESLRSLYAEQGGIFRLSQAALPPANVLPAPPPHSIPRPQHFAHSEIYAEHNSFLLFLLGLIATAEARQTDAPQTQGSATQPSREPGIDRTLLSDLFR